jgi:cell division septum initiation protein DivIVA
VTTEIEELRARVEALERELAERTARAEAAVAAAQERSYWADRLPFDLNRVMPTPIGRAVYLVLLVTVRALQALKRQALRRLS